MTDFNFVLLLFKNLNPQSNWFVKRFEGTRQVVESKLIFESPGTGPQYYGWKHEDSYFVTFFIGPSLICIIHKDLMSQILSI